MRGYTNMNLVCEQNKKYGKFWEKTYSKLGNFLILFPKHDTNELKTYHISYLIQGVNFFFW